MGQHKADKQELNQIIQEYEATIETYKDNMNVVEQLAYNINFNVSNNIDMAIEAKEDIELVKRYWEGMVEADETAKNDYSHAQSGLLLYNSTITEFLEALGQGGENIGALNVEHLMNVINQDNLLTETLLSKMESGIPLTYAEREILYGYIQDVVLTDEMRRDAAAIASMMNEGEIGLLEDHINYTVLETEASFDEEIARIQAYLFSGNLDSSQHHADYETQKKLQMYLEMLQNHKVVLADLRNDLERGGGNEITGDPLFGKVELDYQLSDNGNHHTLSSDVFFSIYQYDNMTREEYINMPNDRVSRANSSVIEYYSGGLAGLQLQNDQYESLRGQQVNLSQETATAELSSFLASNLAGRAAPVVDIAGAYADYMAERGELNRRIEFQEAEMLTTNLNMEVLISRQEVPGWEGLKGDDVNITVQPTFSTMNILDRWKYASLIMEDVPYPDNLIRDQDWMGVSEFALSDVAELDQNYPGLTNYIFDGDIPIDQETLNALNLDTE
ncbi:hypothetical protein [Alkalicoccobacillus porphyridii]|uniref:LXG domain-containing protein n=1 Tax=Alkalicoccobacillus porphyridii TaxID=2597270 RepID=A0A554A492_9BACI|nr:hypothetical protein [Alkalicoccobacillus porphyridii]TSB48507.1 hypothetical protein FN960_02845 [Alkalicoccobacillus porphyridii]